MKRIDAGRTVTRLSAALLVAIVAVACGKKGPPLPPLRPVPARIADLTARVANGQVTLEFTLPAANADGTTPPAVERVEIYRDMALAPPTAPATPPAGRAQTPPAGRGRNQAGPPAGRGQAPASPLPATLPLVSPENLVATLPVERHDVAAPPVGAATRPMDALLPGGRGRFVDQPPSVPAAAATGPWRYVAVPYAGNRRGGTSNLVEVPAGAATPPVSGVAVSYDAAEWQVTWTPGDSGAAFLVFEVAPDGTGEPVRLTPAPLPAAEFRTPVAFGTARCFAVRPVLVQNATTVEGALSDPVCDTPVDTFPPPAPGGLVALQEGAAVVLRWRATQAADLAGYIILRGDDAGENMQPLVTAPVTVASYRDTSVQSGATYTYAVVAVDRATPSNSSGQSNRETVVVR